MLHATEDNAVVWWQFWIKNGALCLKTRLGYRILRLVAWQNTKPIKDCGLQKTETISGASRRCSTSNLQSYNLYAALTDSLAWGQLCRVWHVHVSGAPHEYIFWAALKLALFGSAQLQFQPDARSWRSKMAGFWRCGYLLVPCHYWGSFVTW